MLGYQLRKLYRGTAQQGQVYSGPEYNPLKHGATCLGFAVLPLVLSADVAHVSSMCDELLSTINDVRMEWDSTKEAQAVHARTFPLQCALANLNRGQGLGVRQRRSNAPLQCDG